MKLYNKKYQQINEYEMRSVIILKNKGHSISEIAESLKYGRSTIYRNLEHASYNKVNPKIKNIYSTKRIFMKYSIEKWKMHKQKILDAKIALFNQNKTTKYEQFNNLAHKLIKKFPNKISPDGLIEIIQQESTNKAAIPSKSQFYRWIHKRRHKYAAYMFIQMTRRRFYVVKKQVKPMKYASIRDRPLEATNRTEPGHYEIDTVIGKRTDKYCLLTFRDRYTGRTFIRKSLRYSWAVCAIIKKISSIVNIKTITMDNGNENNDLHKLGDHIRLFNCDAYCSWQKGSIENMHRNIRKWIAKSKSMDQYNEAFIEKIEAFVNAYPTKLKYIAKKDYSFFIKEI